MNKQSTPVKVQNLAIDYLLLPSLAFLYMIYIQIPLSIARYMFTTFFNLAVSLVQRLSQSALAQSALERTKTMAASVYTNYLVPAATHIKTKAIALYESDRAKQLVERVTTNALLIKAKEKATQVYTDYSPKVLETAKAVQTKAVALLQSLSAPVYAYLQTFTTKVVELQQAVLATKIAQQVTSMFK